jgi:hypothetical protein
LGDLQIEVAVRRFAQKKRLRPMSGKLVPCRIRTDVRHDDDPDAFVALLAEHSRQRFKTVDERVREEVALSPGASGPASPPAASVVPCDAIRCTAEAATLA